MTTSVRRISFLFIFICCCVFLYRMTGLQSVQAQEDQLPMSQLETTVKKIVDILEREDAEKGWEAQKEEIIPLIEERLHPEEIAQRALGRHWRDINSSQQEEFTDLFLQLLKNTYINRLKNGVGESEAIFTEQRKRGDRAIVYSLVRTEQQEIPMSYRLIKKEGEWGIYDIVVEGVSLVGNYRKQFDQIMRQGGYSDLISRLREKIETPVQG